jgi:CRP-like cAMP-binding protein
VALADTTDPGTGTGAGGLGDITVDAEPFDVAPDAATLRRKINAAIASGTGEALVQARELLPRLLADPDRRATILLLMAYVEQRLDNPRMALSFIEAAARELADHFDVERLESAASDALSIAGPDAFRGSVVQRLLEECRVRLNPIGSIFETPVLVGTTPEERAVIEDQAKLLLLAPRQVLLREGELSVAVFVVKSGLLGVYLKEDGGKRRLLRCCYPGWLLGETSVLVDGHPVCSATLVAERMTEVWRIDADVMKGLMAARPELAHRIASTKDTHRLASFFTMHEALGHLHVKARDRLIGCVTRIQRFEDETTLVMAGAIPPFASLVAGGEVAVWDDLERKGPPGRVLGADHFVGFRESIHQIASSVTVVARPGATVVEFDPQNLRQLAVEDEQAGAVLEKLG